MDAKNVIFNKSEIHKNVIFPEQSCELLWSMLPTIKLPAKELCFDAWVWMENEGKHKLFPPESVSPHVYLKGQRNICGTCRGLCWYTLTRDILCVSYLNGNASKFVKSFSTLRISYYFTIYGKFYNRGLDEVKDNFGFNSLVEFFNSLS